MQKRSIPIAVVVACTALIALVGYLMPVESNTVPERILLDNMAGKVVFDHKTHFVQYKVPCTKCHHESPQQRDNVQRCGVCHGVAFDDAFRKNHVTRFNDPAACATCHHVTFASKKWGHEAHAKDYGVDCRDCHHKDKSIEPEPQKCGDCHQQTGDKDMPSLRKAVHAKCKSCHSDMFADKVKGCANCHDKVEARAELAKSKGKDFKVPSLYANCATCHIDQPLKDLVPGRMAAFHGQCIKCHEKAGKGPFTKEQCNQCHTK